MKYVFALVLVFVPLTAFAQATTELDVLFDEQQEELNALSERLDQLGESLDQQVQPEVSSREFPARVVEIQKEFDVEGNPQMIFSVETEDGTEYLIDTSQAFVEGLRYKIKEGRKVVVQVIEIDGDVTQVFLVDVVRRPALLLLGLLFASVILAVGWLRGLSALVGLCITFAVLFGFLLPAILKGADAVLVTIVASAVILAVNMHLSHGFSKRTAAAYASTLVGLGLVYVFAQVFIGFANLSGLASEEAVLLYFQSNPVVAPEGILLAAIILGAVGVLDDIAITQSETVAELKEANPSLSRAELLKRAMRIGRHHIASTVNTLVLAYAGVALPLLLLFLSNDGISTSAFLNEEPVAEEIVRTIAGTLALVLTVPISTWFAALVQKR